MRCPNCGSSAQPKIIRTKSQYFENNLGAKFVKTFKCGCGCMFTETTYFKYQNIKKGE